ncbi:MAG: primosomal protein N' [Candidatus Magasanikbacteria bacterium CG10_big_fil_rev_8_21_14_0_10_36_32]|uniref:Primosomal protein N n=1 Tax=Candidatus Magasanikbacteria bacterium CG10_big_fil_rev_8_21_14_0_10_36_32 TaxID=1974646 RepID=A0A2M6W7L6_9BACT|nr:MAG: primosomal protein N' [Candidatus Magasanikbacteria bacterium CG10_big_fil_rev_8_21_14_0_10_36_32]
MLVQIAPIKRLPLSRNIFDYTADKEIADQIKIGQLVKMPFRNSVEFGVITSINQTSSTTITKLKKIQEIVFAEQILTEAQLGFLEELSVFYRTPLNFLLKSNLLPLQKRKITKISIEKIKNKIKQKFDRPKIFIYSTINEKKDYLKNNIEKIGQTLILVPEIKQLRELIGDLPAEIQKKCFVVTSEMSDKEMFELWLNIRNNPKAIVLGTRRALFLPWTNLTSIFLDDEGNPDYKSWDMAPRFHTRDAVIMLAKWQTAQVHFLTHTPSVETYYFADKKVYKSDKLEIKPFRRRFRLIDIKQERRGGNYELLNDDLLNDIKNTIDGDIFLFINRRGDAGFVFCRDCGFVFKCVQCQRPLTYYKNEETIRCHYCRTTQKMPERCDKCDNVTLVHMGTGTAGIETALKKNIDLKKFKIMRIDSASETPNELYNNKQQKIIVGTEYAWGRIDWSQIKLMAILDADMSLIVPEYKAPEYLWQGLRTAEYRLPADSKIYIQTNYPEHPVFQALYQPEKFYQEQLKERRLFKYPPYNFLLKIFYGNTSETAAATAGQKVLSLLQHLTKDQNQIKISCSLESTPRFFRRQYWRIILIKIGYEQYKKNVKLIIKNLPDDWKVDPNPNSLLSLD